MLRMKRGVPGVSTPRMELMTFEAPGKGLLEQAVRRYNEAQETFRWLHPRVAPEGRQEWKRVLKGLEQVCRAIDAGYEPISPPEWPHGLLPSYLGVIPREAREEAQRASRIFGENDILVFDPYAHHFIERRSQDPMLVGVVHVGREERVHFLIAHWDLQGDLSLLIEGPESSRGR